MLHPCVVDYLCRALASINDRLAGGEGLALPPWRNSYLTDYHDLLTLDAEEDEEDDA